MITIFLKLNKKFSNHLVARASKLLVGSSRSKISGLPNKACASKTLTFSLESISFMSKSCLSSFIPKFDNKLLALESASQPSKVANSLSSSAALMPSSSVKSVFAYNSSFSFIISTRRLWP